MYGTARRESTEIQGKLVRTYERNRYKKYCIALLQTYGTPKCGTSTVMLESQNDLDQKRRHRHG